MPYSPRHILCAIALLLAILSLIWPGYPLLAVSVILLAVANFLP